MKGYDKYDLTELNEIKKIVEWQISIAKDYKRIEELKAQLKEIRKRIIIKQPIL